MHYWRNLCCGRLPFKGYINLEAKTAEKFIYIPSINDTVYKTGDLGYMLPNGDLQYVGRRDKQVKINGYRIELDEINSVLLEFPDIVESVSIVDKNKILSFVVCKNTIPLEDVRNYIKTKLPYYMVPTKIISIEKFLSTITENWTRKNYLSIILVLHLLINILQKTKLKNKSSLS